MVQRDFNFAIVDEVDSILIDEARTPLIISGPTEDSSELYRGDRHLHAEAGGGRLREGREDPSDHPDRGRGGASGGAVARSRHAEDRPSLRHPEHLDPAPCWPGAARPQDVRPRRRLHRQGRQDRHHRRVHRPHDGGPALFRGPAPGPGSQGKGDDPEREPDPGLDHLPELFPPVSQARRHDRHRHDRGGGVPRHLWARCGRSSNQRALHPHRRA